MSSPVNVYVDKMVMVLANTEAKLDSELISRVYSSAGGVGIFQVEVSVPVLEPIKRSPVGRLETMVLVLAKAK